MKRKPKIKLIILVGLVVGICFACAELGINILSEAERREEEISKKGGNYSTNFYSILEIIEENGSVTFKKMDPDVFAFELPDVYPSVKWTESDYFDVANFFLRYVGSDELDGDTLIRTLQFDMRCDDIEFGLQDLRVALYRSGMINTEETRIDVGLYIFPKKKNYRLV